MFDKWTGDVANVYDIYAASTSIIMPATNTVIEASYKLKTNLQDRTDPVIAYPNPVSDLLTLDANVKGKDVILMDISGKVILFINHVNSDVLTIPFADLSDGLYLLKIRDKSTTQYIKLLKK